MFEVGEEIVYPTLGVGKVEAIEEREIQGNKQQYYILRILADNSMIMVPTDNAETVGLRQLIGPDEVNKVFEILKGDIEEMSANWTRRYKDNLDRIKSGSIFQMAAVLRNLSLLKQQRELSFGEKKMLEDTKELIVVELSHAQKITSLEATQLIDRIFEIEEV
ncbi:MAG: CarD family transcriptional regulator [bacterium]